MTRIEVLNRIQGIFRDIFNDSELIIDNHTSAVNIDGWDSLNHINLISAIQKEFGIKFDLFEIHHLNNVGAMINSVVKRTTN